MLKLETLDHGAAKIVGVEGEIDLYSSPQLRKALLGLTETQTKHIVVDLSGVSYMDSSGLATLVEGLQNAGDYNGSLMVCGLGPEVRSVFELSRLDQVFEIESTAAAALKRIGQDGSIE